MGLYNLNKVFRPESIAVVGASQKEGSIGSVHVQNLIRGGFEGKIFPVNPHYTAIHGLEAYPSLAKIEHSIDLAIIAIPIAKVPQVIKECVEIGVGGTIIVSAGGRETGAQGLEIENNIKAEAEKGGLRVIGPNCLGIICPGEKLNASFASHTALPGKLAFISQSGAICTAILDLSLKEEIGFSHFVSIGSMLDVDFGDLIDYLGSDSEVKSILLYMENLTNFRKFMSAARAVSRIKPVVVLKAGRSSAAAKAAASHTGALAGDDAVYDAAKNSVAYDPRSRSASYVSSRGRGEVSFVQTDDPTTADGVQELLGIDVVMPIYRAPYFESLTTTEIAFIRGLVDDNDVNALNEITAEVSNVTKGMQLYGHLVMGQTTYYESAYIFRRSYSTGSTAAIKRTASDQNTVIDPLPDLSATIQALIDALPAGEWLKRPVQVRYDRKDGWAVSEEYQWAPKWSIVYGGTYTGGYP